MNMTNLIKKSTKAKKVVVAERTEPLMSVWLTVADNEVTGTFRSRREARESGMGSVYNFVRAL